MHGSDSTKLFPPFQRTPQFSSSLAPFKASVNKNPSYFSLVRSPDVCQEKKQLKEENWKLKQLLHSLNEEMLKLKQKFSQKTEPKALIPESGPALNQNKYIDVLQDSLRTIRNELNKKKQENIELRKKIYKESAEGPKIMSRGSFHSTESMLCQDSHEKVINDLTRTVTYLKSELKILQDEKIGTDLVLSNQKKMIEELKILTEKKFELKIVTLAPVFVQVEKNLLNVPQRLSSSLSMRVDNERLLKRESLKNEKANVDRFFRNFFSELDSGNVEFEDFAKFIENSPQNMTADLFIEALKHFRIRVSQVEVEESFMFVNTGKEITKNEFVMILKQYQSEFDSSKSSDISSGSGEEMPQINIIKHMESGVSTVFDNISLCALEMGVDRHKVIRACQEHLPEVVNFESLVKFFTDFSEYIKDASDHMFLAVNFMEGFELKSRNEIIEKCLNGFFRFPEKFKVDDTHVEEVLSRIIEKKEEVFEKCREYDALQGGELSWEVLFEILSGEKMINTEEILSFKAFCYSFGKNLKKIPYLELVNKVEPLKKIPKIKAFIRMKTNKNKEDN